MECGQRMEPLVMNPLVKLAAHDLVFPKQYHQPEIGPLTQEPLGYLIGKPHCLDRAHLDIVGTVFTIHRTTPNILIFRNFYFALLQLLRRTCVFLTCLLIGQTMTYLYNHVLCRHSMGNGSGRTEALNEVD